MTAPTSFLDGRVQLYRGDCLDILPTLPDNSVDSVCCDPPYHLTSIVKRFGADGAAEAKEGETGAFKRASAGFMGQKWDGGDIAFKPDVWRECLRVLKPGGYLLAFASTRGFGRMSVAIDDAGFVTHPMSVFLTQSPDAEAFLASLDRHQFSAFLRLLDHHDLGGMLCWVFGSGFPKATRIKAEGYEDFRYGGQALKPAIEPIYMGQKPFEKGLSGTENILKWGTGALNIGGCRVGETGARNNGRKVDSDIYGKMGPMDRVDYGMGRWPANLIHDGSEEVLAAFPSDLQSGTGAVKRQSSAGASGNRGSAYGAESRPEGTPMICHGDSGSAARFFYSSKADADDRIGSKHPTVKPVDLMQYLVRLVTPPEGIVLDPFAGTGTTGEAAWREGFNAVLIEREEEYQQDIRERMRLCLSGPDERRREIVKRKGAVDDAGPLFAGVAAQ